MAELFKFRCPACGRLLGVAARKAGRAIHCPQCGTEQVVPPPPPRNASADDFDPDSPADPEEGVGPGEDAIDLGIDLGGPLASPLRAVEAPRPPTPTRLLETQDVSELIKKFLEVAPPVPPLAAPAAAAAPGESDEAASEEDEPDEEPIVATPTEPLRPGGRRRGGGARGRSGGYAGQRDVVLPRTAVVAWSLFALLALGVSFLAGLLVGHYRWR